jgi:hypothetical protein
MRVVSVLFSVLFVALCGIAPADAQRPCVRNRAVFCNRTVSYATAAYVAPTVAYNAVATQVIAVPTSLDFYYSLDNFNRANLIADAVIGRLTLLNQQSLPPAKATAQPPGPMRSMEAVPGKVSAILGIPSPGADEPDARLAKVVGNSCIRCHSGAKLGGGLDLSNLSAIPELQRYKIAAWVLDGSMPKGGEPLPDEQAKLFMDWSHSFKVASASK